MLGDSHRIQGDIRSVARELQQVSQEITQTSEQQMERVQSAAAAQHEIQEMMASTNDLSQAVGDQVQFLVELSSQGQNNVASLADSSQGLREQGQRFRDDLKHTLENLSSSMAMINRIAEKTRLIEEIVFQTKILSFNASIEANRAGEAGRGFSIVAQEIASLAVMTGKAADEIAGIMKDSQTHIQGSLSEAKTTIDRLADGNHQSLNEVAARIDDCSSIFSQITGRIGEVTPSIKKILDCLREQSQGVTVLGTNLIDIDEVANKNRLVASQAIEYGNLFEHHMSDMRRAHETLESEYRIDADSRANLTTFDWTPRLETHIDQIDDEHRILVDKINILIRHFDPETPLADLKRAYEDLGAYVGQHFRSEEGFLRSISYPGLKSHEAIHHKLEKTYGGFAASIQSGQVDSAAFTAFLKNWLFSHIMGVDMQYAHFYHQDSPQKSA
ncbi:MAG: bacteriohemerythrin [Bdellovibrionaceae bacterium]|nr:bacteriohemerythrin [Pseudobdellovibrionaceae bacterium]MBX3032692.1 bacteriohemerythrin [Pseudobdellovibrionaceae bacterium]